MTESELCGSSFDWEGGSPSVFFRPMNPALSAQHYFPEDSPVCLSEKENLGKLAAVLLTPASPLFGSVSYMSQESSCCSLLNNAVIMDDDDNETIPTDERPSLIPAEDLSPIVEPSFNVSDLALVRSSPVDSRVVTTISSEDQSIASLQDFLCTKPQPVDLAFIGSSPGPQWSPGIKDSFKSPNPHSVIRIESTLNFLDGIPSASPNKRGTTADSSLSLSAIIPGMQATPSMFETRVDNTSSMVSSILEAPVQDQPVDDTGPTKTPNRALDIVLEDSTGQISRVMSSPASPVAEPIQQLRGMEPSPVRRLTHHRSSAGPARASLPSLAQVFDVRPEPIPVRESPYLYSASKVLSSEEREMREAEEGRRRLLEQIRQNRRNLEIINTSRLNGTLNVSTRGRSAQTPGPSRELSFSRITAGLPRGTSPGFSARISPSFTPPQIVETSVNVSRYSALNTSSRVRSLSSSFAMTGSSPYGAPRRGTMRLDVPVASRAKPVTSYIYGNHRRIDSVPYAASLRTASQQRAQRPAWR